MMEVSKPEDLLISTIGENGPYTMLICTVTGLTIVLHAWQMLVNKFLTIDVQFYCKPPEEYYLIEGDNFSVEKWINLSAPKLSNGNFDMCRIFELDYSQANLSRPNSDHNVSTIACTEWLYDTTSYQVKQLLL